LLLSFGVDAVMVSLALSLPDFCFNIVVAFVQYQSLPIVVTVFVIFSSFHL
jgi:hypothetical protein